MAKKKYTIGEILEVSKCQSEMMKHYIMEYHIPFKAVKTTDAIDTIIADLKELGYIS